MYNKGADASASSLGASGARYGDQRDMLATVVSDLNKRGGIAGRRIEPVYVAQDSADTRDIPSQEQAWCEALTRDNNVELAASITGYVDLPKCLADRRVPFVARWSAGSDEIYKQLGPYLFTMADPPLERGLLAAASALSERNFYRGAKLGLVYGDSPSGRAGKKALVAYLRSRGVDVASEFAVNTANPDGASSSTSSAVLQMRSAGVTHVSFVQNGYAFLFMTAAESQQWRPHYGLTSFDLPQFLTSVVPSGQLARAVVEGWHPLVDVAYRDQPPSNAASRRCYQLHEAAGLTLTDSTEAGFALAACEVLWFLRASLEESGGAANAAMLSDGAARLGKYTSTLTLDSRFAPSRRFGPNALRDISYASACSCFRYASSALRPIP